MKGGKGGKGHSFFHEQIGRRRERELEIFLSSEKEGSSEEISVLKFGTGAQVVP